MDIADHAHPHALSSRMAVRSHDGWIIAGYVALALITCLAISLAGSGPGEPASELAAMSAMPLP